MIQRSLLLLLTLLPLVDASAQTFRVSTEQPQPALPAGVLIHSSDTLGRYSLVVWGGTLPANGQDTILPVLWMQLFDDTALVGTPQLISDSAARPGGYVEVIGVDDRFVVIWNDARDGRKEAWMRSLDPATVTLDSASLRHRPCSSPRGPTNRTGAERTLVLEPGYDRGRPRGRPATLQHHSPPL